MPVEMRMWRIDGSQPRPLSPSVLPAEKDLHAFLAKDPSLLGERLLIIGSEVPTPYGKRLDLLAIDADGNLHLLELKRDKTPREVVAQVLDYGSWASTLSRDDIIDIASDSSGKTPGTDLRAGVPTLPTLLARRSSDPADARLLALLDSDLSDDADLAEALRLMRAHPAIAEARDEIGRRAEVARAHLAPLPEGPARDALAALCDGVISRSA